MRVGDHARESYAAEIGLGKLVDLEKADFVECLVDLYFAGEGRDPAAAPTAGLHFDESMLAALREMGVLIAYVTLHVGSGTFQRVRVDNIADHKMHGEIFHVPPETVESIRRAKASGGRAEALEREDELKSGHGETDIFITPGFRFRVVERLLTNFHLPRSTLLMLVSAFGGTENIRRAYQHAVNKRYRFFSYGDAMLIERQS